MVAYLCDHLRVELLVPGAQKGVGDVQTLAIKTAASQIAANKHDMVSPKKINCRYQLRLNTGGITRPVVMCDECDQHETCNSKHDTIAACHATRRQQHARHCQHLARHCL